MLALKNTSEDATDSLKLTFTGAADREQSAFGDPPAPHARPFACTTTARFRAYDVGASATLWTDAPAGRGWKYTDKPGTAAGITSFKEQAGAATVPAAPKISIKGKGMNLPDPTVPVPGGVGTVSAQIINSSNATCFGVDFVAPFKQNKENAAATSATFQAVK